MSSEQIETTDFSNMPMQDLVKAAKEGVAGISRNWDLRMMALKDPSYFGNTSREKQSEDAVGKAVSVVALVWEIYKILSVREFINRSGGNRIKISAGFFLAGAGPFISIDPFAGTRVPWPANESYTNLQTWANSVSSSEADRPVVCMPNRIVMGRIDGIRITPTRGLFEHLMENHQQRVVNDLANLTLGQIIDRVAKGIKPAPSRIQVSF